MPVSVSTREVVKSTVKFNDIPPFTVFQSNLNHYKDVVYLKLTSETYIAINGSYADFIKAEDAHHRFLNDLYLSDKQITFYNK